MTYYPYWMNVNQSGEPMNLLHRFRLWRARRRWFKHLAWAKRNKVWFIDSAPMLDPRDKHGQFKRMHK